MLIARTMGFCESTANIWQILGIIVNVIKIVIPLILIILGMIDLGKAVISSDDKAISKAVSSLIKRFIAAVIMFFIPTIVSALFNALSIGDLGTNDANICVQCVTNVNSNNTMKSNDGVMNKTCKEYAKDALGAVNNS